MNLPTSIVKYLPFFQASYIYMWIYISLVRVLPTLTYRCWIAWLKEWASNILTSRLPANFLWWKNPRTCPVVFMGKDDKFERKVRCKGLYLFIACGSCQLYPPLQSLPKFFKVPSDLLPCSVSFWNEIIGINLFVLIHTYRGKPLQ